MWEETKHLLKKFTRIFSSNLNAPTTVRIIVCSNYFPNNMRPWNGTWTRSNLQQLLPLPCFDAGTIFRFFRLFSFRWHWDSSWLPERSLTFMYEAWSVMHRSDLVRSSLRVVVLRRPAGADNPIPSSRFSKSVSKSVAESSELFSKVSRSSFSFSAETKLRHYLWIEVWVCCNGVVVCESGAICDSRESCSRLQQENFKLLRLQI